MNSRALTAFVVVIAVLSMTAISAVAQDAAPKGKPTEWIVPDCDHIMGGHGLTYTPDEGLTLMRYPNMRFGQNAYGLAIMDEPNTLLAVTAKPNTDSTLVMLSNDAGCSWKEIALLRGVYARLYVVAAPGGSAYLWSLDRDWIYYYDKGKLDIRPAPDVIHGLVVDPEDPLHIQIGGDQCQIYESFDGGISFKAVGGPCESAETVYTVDFDPENWDNVLCGGFGAWCSHDAGNSWITVKPFDAENNDRVFQFRYGTHNPPRIFARGNIGPSPETVRCMWLSEDGGETFRIVVQEDVMVPDQDGIPRKVQMGNWPAMAVHPDNSAILYFAFGYYRDEYGTDFYRYDALRDELTVNHTDSLDDINAIVFHPTDPSIMYLGLEEIYFGLTAAKPAEPRGDELNVKVSPNPFNPAAEIRFSLPEAAQVKLEVFNIAGQRVSTVVDRYLNAGDHAFTWDGSHAASGVYLYRLQAGETVRVEKMMLIK